MFDPATFARRSRGCDPLGRPHSLGPSGRLAGVRVILMAVLMVSAALFAAACSSGTNGPVGIDEAASGSTAAEGAIELQPTDAGATDPTQLPVVTTEETADTGEAATGTTPAAEQGAAQDGDATAIPTVGLEPGPTTNPLLLGESAIGKYPERVYVPNTLANTLQVIDPKTFEIIATYPTDAIPHHVTPSWDLTELYVLNTGGNSLLVIDPTTGTPKETIPVIDPYNLYFTPDGENAIVVAERLRRLDILDPDTWELKAQVSVPWPGVDHMAFSQDGSYLVASTEFSGRVVKIDTRDWVIIGEPLAVGGEPIDVLRLPGTNTMLVANQGVDFGGVHVIDADTWEVLDWIPTGIGTHGLMLTHDKKRVFASNRGRGTGEGSITVLDSANLEVLDTWVLPGGSSPDMGQLNVEGDQFWIAGRYNNEVYVINTTDGSLIARIPTDAGPHGLTYFPSSSSPHSLGHNGVYMIE